MTSRDVAPRRRSTVRARDTIAESEHALGRNPPAISEDGGTEPGSLLPLGLTIVVAGILGLMAGAAVTGASVSPLTWYLARASGFTLYLLLWLTVVSGLGLTTRLLDLLGGRIGLYQVHRVATELACVMLGLHMLSLAIDPTVSMGLVGVLVPLRSHVREPWTGLGILAAMGMLAVTLSFWLRRVLGQRGWRALHYGAFPLWFIALVHGIGAGSDTIKPWAVLIYLGTAGVVAFLVVHRALHARRRLQPPIPPRRPLNPGVDR